MIEIDRVSKTFDSRAGPVHALRDLSLTIEGHEFLTVLGPSGCGKTTLLRILGGLERADSGEIRVDGVRVDGPGPDRSVVFQSFALMPWANVLSNVAFGLELRGMERKERERKAESLIEVVGLKGFGQRMPAELSGGMQQRVGLARALAVEPRILLMDEPFSALDEQTRRLLQEELLRIWEAMRTTVFFVTHSMEEAVLLGDRVVLLSPRPGRVEEILPVPLGRPRYEHVDSVERSAAFSEVTHHLWSRLRAMQLDQSSPDQPAW